MTLNEQAPEISPEAPKNTRENFLTNGWNSLEVDVVSEGHVILRDVDSLYPGSPDERFNPGSGYIFATSVDGKGFYKSLGQIGEGVNEVNEGLIKVIDSFGGEEALNLKIVKVSADKEFVQVYP